MVGRGTHPKREYYSVFRIPFDFSQNKISHMSVISGRRPETGLIT